MNNIVFRNWMKRLVKTSGDGGGLFITKAPSEYSLSKVNAFSTFDTTQHTNTPRIASALAEEKLSSSKKDVEKHSHPKIRLKIKRTG